MESLERFHKAIELATGLSMDEISNMSIAELRPKVDSGFKITLKRYFLDHDDVEVEFLKTLQGRKSFPASC